MNHLTCALDTAIKGKLEHLDIYYVARITNVGNLKICQIGYQSNSDKKVVNAFSQVEIEAKVFEGFFNHVNFENWFQGVVKYLSDLRQVIALDHISPLLILKTELTSQIDFYNEFRYHYLN